MYRKIWRYFLFFNFILLISACSSVEKARKTTDILVSSKQRLNLDAILQAEVERQRIRKLRCHSPFLSPMAISGAASHPHLGRAWVDELLRDCPEYSAFISELVLRRAERAGIASSKNLDEGAE